MNHYFKTLAVTTVCTISTIFTAPVFADEMSGWFLRPNLGLSSMSDFSAVVDGIEGASGSVDINLDSGFLAGFGVGYRYNDNLAAEIAWEYRTNDSAVGLPNGADFEDGNYASNTFFINGIYSFDSNGSWKPYLGAGLSWIQEIDIDLEQGDEEVSYSADGDVGFQVFGGLGYVFSDAWELQAEVRVGSVTGIGMEPESNAVGRFLDLDYKPVTFQVALVYGF